MFAVVDELDLAMTGADGVTTAIMGTTIASTSYLGYQALGGENTRETLEHLSHFSEAAAENVASCDQ